MSYFLFAFLSPCNRTVEVVRYMNVKGNLNVLHERRFGASFSTTRKRSRYGHHLFVIVLSVMNKKHKKGIF